MATSTKTPNSTEEQDAAYNPGDAYYNDRFNQIAKHPDMADLANMEAGALNEPSYDTRHGKYTDSHGDTVNSNFNADEPSSNPSENIAAAKEKEGSGGGPASSVTEDTGGGRDKIAGRLSGKGGKSKGPTAGVVGFLLLALIGIGGGSIGLAGSLLVNMKEILHNDRSDGTRSNRLYNRAFMSNKFNSKDKSCGQVAIKCKISTMSKADAKKYIKEGFTIKGNLIDASGKDTGVKAEDDPSLKANPDPNAPPPAVASADTDRISITEIEYPDKTTTKNGKEFYNHADSSPSARRTADRAFSSRASFYTNQFFSKVLNDKFKFSKAKKEFPGDRNTANEKNPDGSEKSEAQKKEELKIQQDEAFDTQTNNEAKKTVRINPDGSRTEEERDYKPQADDRINSAESESKIKSQKGSIAAAIIQATCAAYKTVHAMESGIKLYHFARLGAFALMFFQAADEIKDGRGSGAKTTYLSDSLNYYESNPKNDDGSDNPKYNLSATDSDGYKTATMGDTGALAAFAGAYILGGKTGFGSTLKNVSDIFETGAEKTMPGGLGGQTGRQKMKSFCRLANNPAVALTGCIGSFTGGPVGIIVCGCITAQVLDIPGAKQVCDQAQKLISELLQDILSEVYKRSGIKDKVLEALAELDVNSDTKGVDAGNAIAAGAGLILSTTAAGYGLKPANNSSDNKEVTDYIAYTQPLEDKYIALEREDAKKTPFDASNQYTLLGSFIRNFDAYTVAPTSIYGSLSTVTSSVPAIFKATLTGQTASALYNQPSTAANGDSGRYDHCEDDDLASIGATGDKYCSIVAVSTVSELKSAQKVIDDTSNPDNQGKASSIDALVDYMTLTGDFEGKKETTQDPDDCAKLNGEEDKKCETSKQASISPEGKPIADSQYDKYLTYCTDARKQPWGAQAEPYEQGSVRDQRWYSGEQCMKSGNDPESQMVSNFRMWTNYCLQSGTTDGLNNCYDDSVSSPSSGAPAAANGTVCELLNHPNLSFQEGTKEGLKELCETGKATNFCGVEFKLDQNLINVLMTMANKYKIVVNNFGFIQDRFLACDNGDHPKGQGVDLNGIQEVSGGRSASFNFSSGETGVINDFVREWMAALPSGVGDVGQQGCGGFQATFPPGAPNLNGNHWFPDSCNHLHIGVRNR